MVRNWVTQFGFGPGTRAGAEQIDELDRAKFIAQIGAYFGWTPPPNLNWIVEVCKDDQGQYVVGFFRYASRTEAERLLGNDYEHPAQPDGTRPTRPDIVAPITVDGTGAMRHNTLLQPGLLFESNE